MRSGAAGAIEAAFCWLTLDRHPAGRLPPHLWDGVVDPALPRSAWSRRATRLGQRRRAVVTSNSFAFGGSNVALVLERA